MYLKYCSALTFLTINVHWIKLAFPAALGSVPDTSTLAAARFRRAPNSGCRANSNFPGVPPPRCASQTSDPPGLRLPCCCTENLRRRYASLQNHPRSTRDSRCFTVRAFGTGRAAGPGAREEERFRCGSPSAEPFQKSIYQQPGKSFRQSSLWKFGVRRESTRSHAVQKAFSRFSFRGNSSKRQRIHSSLSGLLAVRSHSQFICGSTCSLLTFSRCFWMHCSKCEIVKL